jgi:hypothetical protein
VPCLFAIFAGFFPRLATIVLWLARPALFDAAFGGAWLWPVLGIVFLPLTTLFFVVLWPPHGLAGFDWFWLVLAVLLDISHWASSGWANRARIPGYAAPSGASPAM